MDPLARFCPPGRLLCPQASKLVCLAGRQERSLLARAVEFWLSRTFLPGA